ncbi:hypothetical protein [Photobacterium swingsii]|uniref:hypothetical protein n=1 Tax=Photobacterium swingsii TaxID=680026 RepID=UPI000A777813
MLTGVETRTSSPVQIKRGADFQSINTQGLYPGGEGAGYAGGILSAGIDGIKIAEAVALDMLKNTANVVPRKASIAVTLKKPLILAAFLRFGF